MRNFQREYNEQRIILTRRQELILSKHIIKYDFIEKVFVCKNRKKGLDIFVDSHAPPLTPVLRNFAIFMRNEHSQQKKGSNWALARTSNHFFHSPFSIFWCFHKLTSKWIKEVRRRKMKISPSPHLQRFLSLIFHIVGVKMKIFHERRHSRKKCLYINTYFNIKGSKKNKELKN